MSKTIAIHISFYNDRWEKMISDGVRALGYEPRFLNTDEVKLEDISDCEILFGMFPPELLAQCPNLRWLQCSFAGVDKYTKPGTFVRDDAILTNASALSTAKPHSTTAKTPASPSICIKQSLAPSLSFCPLRLATIAVTAIFSAKNTE